MTQHYIAEIARLSRSTRISIALVGLGFVGLLVVAACLRPDPRNYGTHEQLGLPACTFFRLTNRRCPSCGMTTSWAHMMQGNVAAAMQTNAGGSLLAVSALLAGPWLVLSAAFGRWIVRPPREWVIVTGAVALVAITLAQWLLRTW